MARKKISTVKGKPSATKRADSDDLMSKIERLNDSGVALIGSFAMLLLAIYVSNSLNEPTVTIQAQEELPDFEHLYKKLGPIPEIDPPRVFSINDDSMESIHQAYRKDGVVAVRHLISPELLDKLESESQKIIQDEEASKTKPSKRKKRMQFHTMKNGAAFLDPPVLFDDETDILENVTAFLEVALLSKVPILASELMGPEINSDEDTVRMMRDIFLTRSSDQEFACGFHVDDVGFWPATAESPGINAWIALDDMPSSLGGGFSLAVGSHRAEWAREAQYITGATTFFPPNGYSSAADMFTNRTGSGTCNIQSSAPHLFRRMEETERIYDLKKGDVIFHQRFLFHRTVPFKQQYTESNKLLYRRYSVRYSPGSARIPPGYGTELSVLWDPQNGGKTANEVCEVAPWYPVVWPSYNITEIRNLKTFVETSMKVAEERQTIRKKEMQPFLQQAAAQQQGRKSRNQT